MVEFLYGVEVFINGLMAGVMYSLVALGFVLIFKASGIFNYAQGVMALFAAMTGAALEVVPATVPAGGNGDNPAPAASSEMWPMALPRLGGRS